MSVVYDLEAFSLLRVECVWESREMLAGKITRATATAENKNFLVYLLKGKALLAMSFVVRVVPDGQLPWKPNECVWQVMWRTLSLLQTQTQNRASSLFFMI